MGIEPRDAVLREVRIGVQGAQTLEKAFETAARLLFEMRGYYRVGVYTREADRLGVRAFAGAVPDERSFPLGKGRVGSAGLSGAVQMVPVVGGGLVSENGLPRPRSECAVPILGGDDVLGVLDVQADRPGEFVPEEQALLQEVAGLLSSAILRNEPPVGRDAVAGTEGWEEDEEAGAEDDNEEDDEE